MPVLQRWRTVSLRMYADDRRPTHFHVVGADFQILVRLADMTVLAGRARAADIAEPMAWASENRDALARKWAQVNERG